MTNDTVTADLEHAVTLAQHGRRVVWAERTDQHRTRVAQMRRLDRQFTARHRGRSAAVRLPNGGQITLVSIDPAALRGLTADAAYAIDPRDSTRVRVNRALAAITQDSPHAEHHLITTHPTEKE